MSRASCWQILGIKRTRDRSEIRRAYARKLKITNPEDDPEGFKALRVAYEQALAGSRVPEVADMPVPATVRNEPEDAHGDVEAVQDETAAPTERPAAAMQPDTNTQTLSDPRLEHAAAQNRLNFLLYQKTSDIEVLSAAFQAVIMSPAMGEVDVEVATEAWLAYILVEHAPYSDRLIGPAVERFGWADESPRNRRNHQVQRLRQRLEDLKFLRDVMRPESPHQGAYKILSRGFRPITLGWRFFSSTTPTMIADFLGLMRSRHPSILDYLDRDTVAHWEAWLGKRTYLPSWGLWVAAASPFCLATIAICAVLPRDLWGAISLLLIIPPALTVAVVIATFGPLVPKLLWRERSYRLTGAMRTGWAPATLAVLGLAALPGETWSIVAVAVGALLATLWAGASGRLDKTAHGWMPWQARAILSEGFLIAWWSVAYFAVPDNSGLPISIAMLTVAGVSAWGRVPAYEAWLRLRRTWHLVLPALGLLAAAGAAYLLLLSMGRPDLRGPATCALAAVVFAHRPLTSPLGAWSFRLKWFTVFAMVKLGSSEGVPSVFAGGGFALLFWAAIVMILTLVEVIGTSRSRA